MNDYFDVIIVGGGYSSLVLANLIKPTVKVAIIEKLDRVGKKILSTGNGRANLSNSNINLSCYHGNNPQFCSKAITAYGVQSLKDFYISKGMLLCQIGDKIFPQSLQANSVLDTLRLSLKSNVTVFTSTAVTAVTKKAKTFCVITKHGRFFSDSVVFAFGASSQSKFGTDGSAFALAESFGHTVTRLRPSLVQLKCSDSAIKSLQGVKVNALVTLKCNGKKVKETVGDLLFVNGGLSGNTVFFLSAYLGESGNELEIDFLPNCDNNRLIQGLLNRKTAFSSQSSDEFLSGVVNKAVAKIIMKKVCGNKNISEISQCELEQAAALLKNYKFAIDSTFGFEMSQVTHGGISTADIDDETMQSKLVDNLFFLGEAIDIDGDCGGFNMHWAYASACAVGKVLNGKSF